MVDVGAAAAEAGAADAVEGGVTGLEELPAGAALDVEAGTAGACAATGHRCHLSAEVVTSRTSSTLRDLHLGFVLLLKLMQVCMLQKKGEVSAS